MTIAPPKAKAMPTNSQPAQLISLETLSDIMTACGAYSQESLGEYVAWRGYHPRLGRCVAVQSASANEVLLICDNIGAA